MKLVSKRFSSILMLLVLSIAIYNGENAYTITITILDSLSDLSSERKVEIYLDGLTSSDLDIRFNSADSLRKIFANNSSNAVSLNVKQRAIEPMIEALSLDDALIRELKQF